MSALPSLRDIENLADPAPSWMWMMDIVRGDKLAVSSLQVLEVNFPFTYFDVDGRYRGGTYIYFPGKNNIDKVTVGFYETEDFAILQAVQTWQGLITNSENIHALPKDYMGNIVLSLFDNRGIQRLGCNLSGCWPAQLSDWQLNYQQSAHLTISVTFAVNSSQFTFYDASGALFDASSPANVLKTRGHSE